MDIQNLNQTPSPKHHKILWSVIGVLLLVVVVSSAYLYKAQNEPQPCVKSRVSAKNPQTGEIKIFGSLASSCQIPAGWIEVQDLVLYFDESATESAILNFKELLQKQPWTESVDYLSAKAALEKFKEQHKYDTEFLKALAEFGNQLPAQLAIHLTEAGQKEIAINFIKSQTINSKITNIESRITSEQSNGNFVGWKTYTNIEYGFEFKYPENQHVRLDKDLGYVLEETSGVGENARTEAIIIFAPLGEDDFTCNNETPIVFANKKATQCTVSSPEFYMEKFIRISNYPAGWKKNNLIHYSVQNALEAMGPDAEVRVRDQILSTFKFTK